MINLLSNIKHPERIATFLLFAILSIIGLSVNTTGNNGDSVMHYLFSHHAFNYPEHFLDHWAKPVFVLLSSPFAYFGFKGIILFNIICVTLTSLITYYLAKELKLKYSLLVFPLFLFAPLFFNMIFSGLTEYLFGLILTGGILLMQKKHILASLILISFLPMVRSEGLIILGIFACYLIYQKHIKFLPVLFAGQVIYTIIGAFYYADILWILHEIPYNNMDSPYGQGGLFDFVFKLMYVIEKPLFILLVVGLLFYLFQLVKRKIEHSIFHLVIASTLSILIAHSIFWYLGIFNSMGLPRVLIVIVPLILIIVLYAVNLLISLIPQQGSIVLIIGVLIIAIITPFIPKKNGINYNLQMFEIKDHNLIDHNLVPYVKSELKEYSDQRIYYSHPYISLALDIDYFDHSKHLEMQHLFEETLSPGTLIIWDNWFSELEANISFEQLINSKQLHLKTEFRLPHESDITFAIFVVE